MIDLGIAFFFGLVIGKGILLWFHSRK
jgi:hypothetical protein